MFLQTDTSAGSTLFLGDTELHIAAGSTTVTATRTYRRGSTPVAERSDASGATVLTWLLADQQDTVTAQMNDSSGTLSVRRQDPFGQARGGFSAAWTDGHGFLNAVASASTGLSQLGARLYDAALGRFVSVDPVLSPTNPQQNNGYSYSGNNPVTNSDPSGLMFIGSELGVGHDSMAMGMSAPNSPTAPGNSKFTKKGTPDWYSNYLSKRKSDSPGCGSDYNVCGSTKSLNDRAYAMAPEWAKQLQGIGAIVSVGLLMGLACFAICGGLASASLGTATGTEELSAAAKMAQTRATGATGEDLAGVIKNTQRIPSATNSAAYRIPDELQPELKKIGEVKNVSRLSYTGQLQDFVAYARDMGYSFDLYVRNSTTFTPRVQDLIDTGVITRVPTLGP